jgi:hypothetical protein
VRRKVVEPSEILLEDDGTIRPPQAIQMTPWIRFLARMTDYFLFILALRGLHTFFPGPLPFGKWESLIPFEYFVWIPLEAVFLWTLGTTPGKWFLNIDIRHGRQSRPDFLSSLRRSFHVWFRGLGMVIPFLSLICMWVAYSRLKLLHQTSWDRDDQFQISHRFVPKWKLVVASIMTLGALGFYFYR